MKRLNNNTSLAKSIDLWNKVNELVDTINLQSEIIEKQEEEIKGLKEAINNHEFRIDGLETKGHDYGII